MNPQPTTEMVKLLEEVRTFEALLPDPFDFPPHIGRAINQLRGKFWSQDLTEMQQVSCYTVAANPSLTTPRFNVVAFVPTDAQPGAIIYVHGGGWAYSAVTLDEPFARNLAWTSKHTVLVIDYGLAPERAFPGPLHDVVAAWRAILSEPERFGVNGPLILAGDSAGANLALAAMLHELADDRPLPKAALLLYGVYRHDPPSLKRHDFDSNFGPKSDHMDAFWNWYVPDLGQRDANPLAAPLAALDDDLLRLPPLFLLEAEVDSLAGETQALAARLGAIGRRDQYHIEPGVVHGFLQMGSHLQAARACTNLIGAAACAFIDGAS